MQIRDKNQKVNQYGEHSKLKESRTPTSEMSKWKSRVFPGSSLEELLNMRVKAISGELQDSEL